MRRWRTARRSRRVAVARHGEARRHGGVIVTRDDSARDDLPGADAAGFPARRARRGRRARTRRRRGTDEAALAEQRRPPGPRRRRRSRKREDHDRGRSRRGAAADGPAAAPRRVGTGYDLHRLVEGRPLVIGGVTHPVAIAARSAHSDGDVACHAATDAILGAAGLGDIGRHFPDTDPAWKDADSLALLRAGRARSCASRASRSSTWTSPSILERPKIKDLHRARCAHAWPARSASTVARQRQGQDQRRRGCRRPRRGDRRPRGRAPRRGVGAPADDR